MRTRPIRGALIGLAMVVAVFAAAGADFVAGQDPAVPTQWTVGGDDKFAGEPDDGGLGMLDLPTGNPVLDIDVFDPSPTGN